MNIQFFHPLYAIAGVGLLSAIAWLVSRVTPYYRRELNVDDSTRLTPLDGLRGILCFAVMYHHAAMTYGYFDTGLWVKPASPFYTLLGDTSVAFFFCITAFLFWSRVLAHEGRLEPMSFLRGRMFRVVPLYAFSCIVAVAIVFRTIDWTSLHALRGLATMGLVGVRPWGQSGNVNLLLVDAGVTWTLQYEWAFYVALPALALMAGAGGSRRVLFIGMAVLILAGKLPCVYFLSGILAAHVAREPRFVAALNRRRVAAGVLLLISALPLITHNGFGVLAIIVTTLAFIPLACGNSLFGLLNTRGLRTMGIVSYSVYLLHGMSLYVARPLLNHLRGRSIHGIPSYWVTVFALSCLVLTISLATYRWIELPFIQMEKRIRSSSRTSDLFRSLSAVFETRGSANESAPTLLAQSNEQLSRGSGGNVRLRAA